jgi:23S rRNA (uracil1939-C5)-methyltransferase
MAMKKRSLVQPSMSNPPPHEAEPATATIEVLGAQGQGIAHIGGEKHFIPFTLPGERVRAVLHGQRTAAISIEAPSPERIEPVCKHFGTCGGCTLQHWADALYSEWKQGLVTSALARAGIAAPVEPLRSYPVSSRRRAALTARSDGGKIALGYNAARTHDAVDLEECPILLPEIAQTLPHLKAALSASMPAKSEAKITVTAAANGLDCAIQGPVLRAAVNAKVIGILGAAGIIRAFWNDDLVLLAAAPLISFSGIGVTLPPNVFLQAVEQCEHDMARWVLDALSSGKAASGPICDLFAGLGAFTFPAATLAPVTAYEESQAAVVALTAAAKRAKGLKAVSATRRDLYRNPLGPLELNKFASVIIDPPREGAEAQARALVSSKIATVAMLSCNPTSFARDAAILTGGGFQLTRLAAFDQFRFSAHVEIAALFQRPAGRKGGLSPALRR